MTAKRIAAGALLAVAVAGCAVGTRVACDRDETPQKPLKVLMIGNSFSICTLRDLPAVAESTGRPLDLASLYIGGCELKRHWNNFVAATTNETAGGYRYDRAVNGRRVVDNKWSTIPAALKSDAWDVVTVQQASHESWRAESYQPYADNLIAKIRALAPTAKIVVQQTWSYSKWDRRIASDVSYDSKPGTWGFDQEGMYARARTNYYGLAAANGFEVIPTGDAVQAYRREVGYDVFADCVGYPPARSGNGWHDTIHLNRAGEYLQALVWYGKLFKTDPRAVAYRPDEVTPARAALFRDAAAEALGYAVDRLPIRGVFPAGDMTVELNPTNQLALYATTSHVQRIEMLRADLGGDQRRFGRDNVWRDAAPFLFRWDYPKEDDGVWELQVSKSPDFAQLVVDEVVFKHSRTKLREVDGRRLCEYRLMRPNFELGQTYYWRVISNVRCSKVWSHGRVCACTDKKPQHTMAAASFKTGWTGSRWMRLEGRVDNFRDIGGKIGRDGCRYRQGLVYRAQGFNDNSETGDIPGRNRLTVEDVRYLTGTLGIRTDLDLRGPREVACMNGVSPMGESVRFVNNSSPSYKAMFEPWGKDVMARNFRVFADRANYPVYFHCIAGADRTGALGIVLLGVAGVARDAAVQDWEETFYPYTFGELDPGQKWRDLSAMTDGLDAYGAKDDSFMRKCELYLMDCGIAEREIARYRSIVLEK